VIVITSLDSSPVVLYRLWPV